VKVKNWGSKIAIFLVFMIVCFCGYTLFITWHSMNVINMGTDVVVLGSKSNLLRVEATTGLLNDDHELYQDLISQADKLWQEREVLNEKYESYSQWLDSISIFF